MLRTTLLPRVSFAFFFAVLAGNSTVSSHLSVTIGDKGEIHDCLNTFSSPSLLEVLGYELFAAGSQGYGGGAPQHTRMNKTNN